MTTNDTLFEQFMTVHLLMAALRHKEMKSRGPLGDTTRGQGRVLALLKLHDGVSTKDMATVLGIRVSSLNETLGRMEKDGLVTREPSADDKRVMLVRLTEKGSEIEQEAQDVPELLFDGFTDEERATLSGYLDRMADAVNGELGEDGREMLEDMRRHREEFFGHGHGRRQHGRRPRHCGPYDGGFRD